MRIHPFWAWLWLKSFYWHCRGQPRLEQPLYKHSSSNKTFLSSLFSPFLPFYFLFYHAIILSLLRLPSSTEDNPFTRTAAATRPSFLLSVYLSFYDYPLLTRTTATTPLQAQQQQQDNPFYSSFYLSFLLSTFLSTMPSFFYLGSHLSNRGWQWQWCQLIYKNSSTNKTSRTTFCFYLPFFLPTFLSTYLSFYLPTYLSFFLLPCWVSPLQLAPCLQYDMGWDALTFHLGCVNCAIDWTSALTVH